FDFANAAAGHAVDAGVGQGDAEVLLGMQTVIANLGLLPEADGEVVVHGLVVEEIVLDDAALIAQAQDELAEAIMRVALHDVPQDGAAAHFDHRFRAEFGFLPEARSQSAAQNYHLHKRSLPAS